MCLGQLLTETQIHTYADSTAVSVVGYTYTLNVSPTLQPRQTTAYINKTGLPVNCWLIKGSEC